MRVKNDREDLRVEENKTKKISVESKGIRLSVERKNLRAREGQ